jgi:mannose-6-phosphate isomerase-like protein (cupin superfamily)
MGLPFMFALVLWVQYNTRDVKNRNFDVEGAGITLKPLENVLVNPVSGDQLTFLTSSAETGGAMVKSMTELRPGSKGIPMHYHLTYTETFTVVKGKLDICVGGKQHHRVLEAGESVHVPLRTLHQFWNSSDELVVFTDEVRPGWRYEASMRVFYGLARDGKVNKAGVPTNLWEIALVTQLSESYFPGIPILVQQGLFSLLGTIAQWRGYDPVFSLYTGGK